MKRISFFLLFTTLTATHLIYSQQISHGPMLGAVTENTAKIWFRTDMPCKVSVEILLNKSSVYKTKVTTEKNKDNTAIIPVNGLSALTRYTYRVSTEKDNFETSFKTTGKELKDSVIRIAYGYGYIPAYNDSGSLSVFNFIPSKSIRAMLYIGDFPYTKKGEKYDIENGHKTIRQAAGFRELTSGVPVYGIYDDHDFGPNDCDGRHPYAQEAYEAFLEYWPNPTYGNNNKGGYTRFSIGDVDFFLLDCRYFARQDSINGTILGAEQFSWLCAGLLNSNARYKVLISSVPMVWDKTDCWGSVYYKNDRDKLFSFIADKHIKGIICISGDKHRCDICRFKLNDNRFLYDFTSGALAQEQRFPPETWPDEMIYSYGNGDKNMYSIIEFYPSGEYAVIFKSYSAKNGMLHQVRLTKEELGY